MWLIVVYWLVGFVLAALFVVPIAMIRHVKDFASSAAHDIRGS